MSSALKGGLTPVRTLGGKSSFRLESYQKSTAGGDESLVYVGDPVKLNADGTVQRLVAADTSAAAASFIGVVEGIAQNEEGQPRVHALTNGTNPRISATADADWLRVCVDPDVVYAARIAGSAGQSQIGSTVNVTTTARVTAAGISGTILDATVSAAGENPFRIVNLSVDNLDGQVSDSKGRVEVIANNHAFRGTTSV